MRQRPSDCCQKKKAKHPNDMHCKWWRRVPHSNIFCTCCGLIRHSWGLLMNRWIDWIQCAIRKGQSCQQNPKKLNKKAGPLSCKILPLQIAKSSILLYVRNLGNATAPRDKMRKCWNIVQRVEYQSKQFAWADEFLQIATEMHIEFQFLPLVQEVPVQDRIKNWLLWELYTTFSPGNLFSSPKKWNIVSIQRYWDVRMFFVCVKRTIWMKLGSMSPKAFTGKLTKPVSQHVKKAMDWTRW